MITETVALTYILGRVYTIFKPLQQTIIPMACSLSR